MAQLAPRLDRLQAKLSPIEHREDGRKRGRGVDSEGDGGFRELVLDSLDRDDTPQDVHRVRVDGQSVQGDVGALREGAMTGELQGQAFELGSAGQPALPKQEGDLLE